MPSNSISSRRGLLRRPIVCRKGPPPIPDCQCSIRIETLEAIFIDETYSFVLQACNARYSPDLNLPANLLATGGFWAASEDISNCGPGDSQDWTAPAVPGFVTIGFTVTYPDESTCGAQIILEVLDDP